MNGSNLGPRAGRIIYSRGPIIRTIEIFNALVGVAAIASLVIALTAISDQVSGIEKARANAARDSCQLLRGLVFAATPKGQLTRASAYINATPLRNCDSYANAVRNGHGDP